MSTHGEAVEDIKKAKAVLDTPGTPETTELKHPDPKKHLYISLVKSAIRIVAGGCLVSGNLIFAGAGFILAEALGIVEELV
jgi:hypothetical protein